MRTTDRGATVRLYRLIDTASLGGSAETLLYGPLDDALTMAAQLPEDVQSELYLATDNDVIAYLDLVTD